MKHLRISAQETSNYDKHIENLQNEIKSLCEKVIQPKIINQAKEILQTEPNVIPARAPVTICGDIHGQFNDLIELFRVGGNPPVKFQQFSPFQRTPTIYSWETMLIGVPNQLKPSHQFFLSKFVTVIESQFFEADYLKGNHENREINKIYGFYDECFKKYGNELVWKYFTDVFGYLPLASIVEDQIFCAHGGLSPALESVEQIKSLNRIQDVPHEGPMCDLLWSDPEESKNGWSASPRGAGWNWGADITDKFLHQNNLRQIARAHQLVMEGIQQVHNKKCVTIFSAPNYCYRCGNQAAIMEVDDNMTLNYIQFDPAPRDNEPHATRRVPQYFL